MQIVKYKWEDWEPSFVLADNGNTDKLRLLNQEISLKTVKKRCIGFFQAGRHFKCPENREITSGWSCDPCKVMDDYFMCIRCDGRGCINPKQRDSCMKNNYFVYLAAFGQILKVGISYERRLLERLVEQGADFGAKIAMIRDGKNVRIIEQQIKQSLSAVDRVLGDEKHANLFANPNQSAASIYKAILRLRSNNLGCLIAPEIYDMRKYYMLHNVPVIPEKMEIKDSLSIIGKVVAAKGNMLILNSEDSFYSINAHRLIGYDIEKIE